MVHKKHTTLGQTRGFTKWRRFLRMSQSNPPGSWKVPRLQRWVWASYEMPFLDESYQSRSFAVELCALKALLRKECAKSIPIALKQRRLRRLT